MKTYNDFFRISDISIKNNKSQSLFEMEHLYRFLEDKEQKFINDLFSKYVFVTEKLDGVSFSARFDGNEWIFYKRNKNKPISVIDISLIRLYDLPIGFFNSKLSNKKLLNKVKDKTFSFELITSLQPQMILYDRIPKNNLVLISIDGRQEKDELEEYGDLLDVETTHIIFEGFLSDKQKSQLNNILTLSPEELKTQFNTTSFTKIMFTILNPELKSSLLHKDLEKTIEGIVINFGKNEKDKSVVLKIVEKEFEKLHSYEVTKKEKKTSETKDKLIELFINFVSNKDETYFDEFKLNNQIQNLKNEEKVLKFIDNTFFDFYTDNKTVLNSLNLLDETEEIFKTSMFLLRNINGLLNKTEKLFKNNKNTELQIKSLIFYFAPRKRITKEFNRDYLKLIWEILDI